MLRLLRRGSYIEAPIEKLLCKGSLCGCKESATPPPGMQVLHLQLSHALARVHMHDVYTTQPMGWMGCNPVILFC